jgi:hypothetical protein
MADVGVVGNAGLSHLAGLPEGVEQAMTHSDESIFDEQLREACAIKLMRSWRRDRGGVYSDAQRRTSRRQADVVLNEAERLLLNRDAFGEKRSYIAG